MPFLAGLCTVWTLHSSVTWDDPTHDTQPHVILLSLARLRGIVYTQDGRSSRIVLLLTYIGAV